MEVLGGLLIRQASEMAEDLAAYSEQLVQRPQELPEFVAFIEASWQHLDPTSGTRVQLTADFTHMQRLHHTYT